MSRQKLIQTYRESDNLVDWLQRFVGKVAEIENFRDVDGTGNPAFVNGWSNFGTPWENVGFYKDPFNIVHIRGTATGGTADTTIFSLPVGYRPSGSVGFVGFDGNSSPTRFMITAAGAVITLFSGSSTLQSLNCSFRVN